MTLHQTVDISKKVLLWLAVTIAAIFVLVILYRLAIIVKNLIFPPKIQSASHSYGTLPLLEFPQSKTQEPLTYSLNTVSGELPKFPDRLNVFPIIQPEPSLLNLNKAKSQVTSLGFIGEGGKTLPETALDEINYQWSETTGIRKRIVINTVTFNFVLRSSYTSSLTILDAESLGSEKNAYSVALNYLSIMGLAPKDIDKNKTKTRLYSLVNGALTPTTSISKAQIIEVNLYQKNVTYVLNTGIPEVTGGYKTEDIDLPIVYPNPPSSTMNFLIGAGLNAPQVVGADFIHQEVKTDVEAEATYLIKSASEAFEELKNGEGYIASANGDTKVAITKVYLAYFLGEKTQNYLMPVIVFEDDRGFMAYVSAIRNEWTK